MTEQNNTEADLIRALMDEHTTYALGFSGSMRCMCDNRLRSSARQRAHEVEAVAAGLAELNSGTIRVDINSIPGIFDLRTMAEEHDTLAMVPVITQLADLIDPQVVTPEPAYPTGLWSVMKDKYRDIWVLHPEGWKCDAGQPLAVPPAIYAPYTILNDTGAEA